MTLKYRIKEISFPDADTIWIPQYRILFIWVSIGLYRGHLPATSITHCETYKEAKERIKRHKRSMIRASQWTYRSKRIIKDE